MDKLLKDVFKDYRAIGDVADCIVKEVNLYKKTNKLAIRLETKKHLNEYELMGFETYLKDKFNTDVEIDINNVEIKVSAPATSVGSKSVVENAPNRKPVFERFNGNLNRYLNRHDIWQGKN